MKDWIVNAPQGGRRRAGRRWNEGDTVVKPDEQSQEMWNAIKGDPAMHISEAADDPVTDIADGGGTGTSDPGSQGTPPTIEDAIRALKPGDYTAGGKPKTEAIAAVIVAGGGGEIAISAAERDAVWTTMLAAGFTIPVEA